MAGLFSSLSNEQNFFFFYCLLVVFTELCVYAYRLRHFLKLVFVDETQANRTKTGVDLINQMLNDKLTQIVHNRFVSMPLNLSYKNECSVKNVSKIHNNTICYNDAISESTNVAFFCILYGFQRSLHRSKMAAQCDAGFTRTNRSNRFHEIQVVLQKIYY